MNATVFTWRIAIRAASGVVPRPTNTTFTKNTKARTSKNQLKPDGHAEAEEPRESRPRSGPVPARASLAHEHREDPRERGPRSTACSRGRRPRRRAAGSPSRPSMRSQLPATFSTIAAAFAASAGGCSRARRSSSRAPPCRPPRPRRGGAAEVIAHERADVRRVGEARERVRRRDGGDDPEHLRAARDGETVPAEPACAARDPRGRRAATRSSGRPRRSPSGR